jgi:hypothetical protein
VALPAIFLSNQPVTRRYLGMVIHDPDPPHLTTEQYRERAKLARYTAAAAKSALLRQDLLEVASEYERLAESAASSPSGG